MRDCALIVGVNEYVGELMNLEGCENDAVWARNWFRKFPGMDVYCALSSKKETYSFEIEKLFYKILHNNNARNKKYRRFYLFFAGHGLENGKENIQCILSNSSEGKYFYADLDYIKNHLMNYSGFDELILVLDCCRIDNRLYDSRSIIISDDILDKNFIKKNIVVKVFSTSNGEEALESNKDYSRGDFSKNLEDILDVMSDKYSELSILKLEELLFERFKKKKLLKKPQIIMEQDINLIFPPIQGLVKKYRIAVNDSTITNITIYDFSDNVIEDIHTAIENEFYLTIPVGLYVIKFISSDMHPIDDHIYFGVDGIKFVESSIYKNSLYGEVDKS